MSDELQQLRQMIEAQQGQIEQLTEQLSQTQQALDTARDSAQGADMRAETQLLMKIAEKLEGPEQPDEKGLRLQREIAEMEERQKAALEELARGRVQFEIGLEGEAQMTRLVGGETLGDCERKYRIFMGIRATERRMLYDPKNDAAALALGTDQQHAATDRLSAGTSPPESRRASTAVGFF